MMTATAAVLRDAMLAAEVRIRFAEHPMLGRAELQVDVREGVLTVSGTVDSYEQRYAAENAARQVTGLRGIAMRVHVRASDSQL